MVLCPELDRNYQSLVRRLSEEEGWITRYIHDGAYGRVTRIPITNISPNDLSDLEGISAMRSKAGVFGYTGLVSIMQEGNSLVLRASGVRIGNHSPARSAVNQATNKIYSHLSQKGLIRTTKTKAF